MEPGRKDPLKSLKKVSDHRTKWKLSHMFSHSSSGDHFEVRFLSVTKSWFAAVLSDLFLGKQNGHTHIHVMESFITTEKLHTKAFLHRVYCECEVNGKEPYQMRLYRGRGSSNRLCVCVCVLQEVLWIKISGSISTCDSRRDLWTTSCNKLFGTTSIFEQYPVSNSSP